jgi:uncharacterized membrane protein YbhN (UPF0104 family)
MTDRVKDKPGSIRVLTQWLPLIAFFAAAFYLWRSDLAPEVQLASVPLIIAASGLQLLAFSMRAWLLRDLLQRFGIALPYSVSVSCIFKPILSKYIPGKVWLLISTAGLLNKYGVPFGRASFIIAVFQVMLANSGLILGALALLAFQMPGLSEANRLLLIFLSLGLLALLLGSSKFLDLAQSHIPRLRTWWPEQSDFPALSAPAFYAVLHWLVIGLAFTLFLLSVNVHAGWYPVLFQPLAINLGVLAFIVPGGLGVREGAMAAYLTLADVSLSFGISLAIAARIWFFVGEVIAFLIGLLLDRLYKVHQTDQHRANELF